MVPHAPCVRGDHLRGVAGMSELTELIVDIARTAAPTPTDAANLREITRASDDAIATMREAASELTRLQAENSALRQELTTAQARGTLLELALGGCVKIIEDSWSDSDGRYPYPDGGCIDCTLGTVPNHLSTGPCAYHEAKRLLSPVTARGERT